MHSALVQIVRFVDADFPGWVECILTDCHGQRWNFLDKAPIFTETNLNANSSLPQPGTIRCEIIQEWCDRDGRACCTIDTKKPDSIAAQNGETQFEIFTDQTASTG